MLEHLVHYVKQSVCLERWSRLLHEITTFLKHTSVSYAIIHEFAEAFRNLTSCRWVVWHLFDCSTLQELAHGDDTLHKFPTCVGLNSTYKFIDPEILLTHIVLNEEAASS